jgi:ABC-type bacteriocin/lantibiotic exporter with double-glycine peptidase domain
MVVNRINLEINEGEFVAIVGPSGAGKTTLIDLILGILEPTHGQVLVSEEKPLSSINLWPGSIAYVPQAALIVNGSIKENIQLGFPDAERNIELIWDALQMSGFDEFVKSLPGEIDYEVGEKGARLSGGQRQRLVIARALFSKPRLLVLDEATSALDGQTESDVSRSVLALRGKTTVLMIAHRLSTVTSADKVIYIDGGNLVAQGSFAEVRRKVPDFEKQAQLMGL